MASKIKLTKAQRKVIELLQKGEVIINDEKWFYVSDGFTSHRIKLACMGRINAKRKAGMGAARRAYLSAKFISVQLYTYPKGP